MKLPTSGDAPGRPCSIAAALKVVGERWSLLAIREITFGNHRFDRIAENTGASRDILTARLRSLEEVGVLRRVKYNDRPARFEYRLTEAGRELIPVLSALRTWGDRWLLDEPPTVVMHTCGHELKPVSRCGHCGEDLNAYGGPAHVTFRTPGWDRQGPTGT